MGKKYMEDACGTESGVNGAWNLEIRGLRILCIFISIPVMLLR